MSNDLVKRLRTFRPVYGWPEEYAVIVKPSLGEEAADRIEAQDKRNKELEAALYAIQSYDRDTLCYDASDLAAVQDIAFAALSGEKKDGSYNP